MSRATDEITDKQICGNKNNTKHLSNSRSHPKALDQLLSQNIISVQLQYDNMK